MWINYFKNGKPESIEAQDVQHGDIRIIGVDIANGDDCTFYGSYEDFCKKYSAENLDSQDLDR